MKAEQILRSLIEDLDNSVSFAEKMQAHGANDDDITTWSEMQTNHLMLAMQLNHCDGYESEEEYNALLKEYQDKTQVMVGIAQAMHMNNNKVH